MTTFELQTSDVDTDQHRKKKSPRHHHKRRVTARSGLSTLMEGDNEGSELSSSRMMAGNVHHSKLSKKVKSGYVSSSTRESFDLSPLKRHLGGIKDKSKDHDMDERKHKGKGSRKSGGKPLSDKSFNHRSGESLKSLKKHFEHYVPTIPNLDKSESIYSFGPNSRTYEYNSGFHFHGNQIVGRVWSSNRPKNSQSLEKIEISSSNEHSDRHKFPVLKSLTNDESSDIGRSHSQKVPTHRRTIKADIINEPAGISTITPPPSPSSSRRLSGFPQSASRSQSEAISAYTPRLHITAYPVLTTPRYPVTMQTLKTSSSSSTIVEMTTGDDDKPEMKSLASVGDLTKLHQQLTSDENMISSGRVSIQSTQISQNLIDPRKPNGLWQQNPPIFPTPSLNGQFKSSSPFASSLHQHHTSDMPFNGMLSDGPTTRQGQQQQQQQQPVATTNEHTADQSSTNHLLIPLDNIRNSEAPTPQFLKEFRSNTRSRDLRSSMPLPQLQHASAADNLELEQMPMSVFATDSSIAKRSPISSQMVDSPWRNGRVGQKPVAPGNQAPPELMRLSIRSKTSDSSLNSVRHLTMDENKRSFLGGEANNPNQQPDIWRLSTGMPTHQLIPGIPEAAVRQQNHPATTTTTATTLWNPRTRPVAAPATGLPFRPQLMQRPPSVMANQNNNNNTQFRNSIYMKAAQKPFEMGAAGFRPARMQQPQAGMVRGQWPQSQYAPGQMSSIMPTIPPRQVYNELLGHEAFQDQLVDIDFSAIELSNYNTTKPPGLIVKPAYRYPGQPGMPGNLADSHNFPETQFYHQYMPKEQNSAVSGMSAAGNNNNYLNNNSLPLFEVDSDSVEGQVYNIQQRYLNGHHLAGTYQQQIDSHRYCQQPHAASGTQLRQQQEFQQFHGSHASANTNVMSARQGVVQDNRDSGNADGDGEPPYSDVTGNFGAYNGQSAYILTEPEALTGGLTAADVIRMSGASMILEQVDSEFRA